MSELMINKEMVDGSQEQYDAIETAIKQLASSSEADFEKIKKEKWFVRVFDMVTGAKNVKDKKRLASQIGSLAQAQQILIEILLRLSENDKNISELVKQNANNIEKLSENDLILLDKIKYLERKSLGIKEFPSMYISKEEDKQLLIACVHKIADCQVKPSNEQIEFFEKLTSFYNADNIQMLNPFANFVELDSNVKKIIFTCCLMYAFLKNDSFEFNEDFNSEQFDKVIEKFDFGSITTRELKEQIESNYKVSGINGFLSNSIDEIDDTFVVEIDFEDDENLEMSDETINSILNIKKGEVKKFKNLNIHISAFINCEGTLELENCVVYYNESEKGDEITLDFGANLFVKNSKFICKGYDKKPFITSKGNNTVVFEECTFIECSNFYYAVNGTKNINCTVNGCQLINCYCKFLDITSSCGNCIASISNNYFLLTEFKELDYCSAKQIICLICSEGIFKNNILETKESFSEPSELYGTLSWDFKFFFNCDKSEVSNCTFIGSRQIMHTSSCVNDTKFINCTECIRSYGGAIIDNCVFDNCTEIIYCDDTTISNCQFSSCKGGIIYGAGLTGGVRVEFCEFYNIRYSNSHQYKNSRAALTFWRDLGSDYKCNYVKKCIFDGIDMNEDFLIQTREEVSRPGEPVAKIIDCDFRNCTTKRTSGKIIKEYAQYMTLLMKTKEIHAIVIENCRGLNNINKEGNTADNASIKDVSSDGNSIGSTIRREAKKGGIVLAAYGLAGPIGGLFADMVINASSEYETTIE